MTEPLVITRITHSCHLIQIGGLTVLTDPWFSQRPFYHPGEPIALRPEALPHLDAVVISHEHYDHCDLDAFRRYPARTCRCWSPDRSSRRLARRDSATSARSSRGSPRGSAT
ncbi:Outer membrane protein romA [[Actinomadura] parvosata subsp. kistnae]|nr:Outer membrane protein romA [Actinomadura parvosata subsp. kistnae]